ncbi:MAG: AMP-binding protein, partial [Muribaculaceae bacterium]|nr:AMP-binding protein [Muribaculaceae bacterium]
MFEAPHSILLCEISRHAIDTPDKVALVEGDTQVTYAQLMANIARAAHAMHALGLKPGDRIVLAAQKELGFVYHYFAAHLLG